MRDKNKILLSKLYFNFTSIGIAICAGGFMLGIIVYFGQRFPPHSRLEAILLLHSLIVFSSLAAGIVFVLNQYWPNKRFKSQGGSNDYGFVIACMWFIVMICAMWKIVMSTLFFLLVDFLIILLIYLLSKHRFRNI